MTPTFAGSYVALPTPFREPDVVDLDAYRRLIEEHAARGTRGVVVCGTTGEAGSLTEGERRGLVHATVEYAAGRLRIVAGVGTNCTRTSVALAREAAECGVDGLLVVTPYYNRPSRLGLLRHFGAVADATELPVMLYNVPSRTACDLRPPWAAEIARANPTVVAIKEATDDLARVEEICAVEGLEVLSGEDKRIADFMQRGGVGAVSVVGNVAPEAVVELIDVARPGGDDARAAELVEHLAPLIRDLFIESNPVPVKAALAALGLCRPDVRGPLAPLEDANRAQLERTLRSYGDALAPRTSASA